MRLLDDVEDIIEDIEGRAHRDGLTLRHVLDLQIETLRRVKHIMSVQDEINAALAEDLGAIQAVGQRIADELAPLQQHVDDLVAKNADLAKQVESLTGQATVPIDTAALLDGLGRIKSIADGLATAAPAPATPDPPTGVTPPADAPPASGGSPTKPLYTHNDVVFGPVVPADAAAWPKADVQTAETPPRDLFEFTSDQSGGPATGASAEWPTYSGPTQPVPPPAPGGSTPAGDAPAAVVGDSGGQAPADVPPAAGLGGPLGLGGQDGSASGSLASSAPPPPPQ